MQNPDLVPEPPSQPAPFTASVSSEPTHIFDWSNRLLIGEPVIDGQHQDLLGKLNEIHLCIQAGWRKEAMDGVLLSLIDETILHFSTEESIMDMYNYPEKNAHEHIHGELLRMLEQHIEHYSDDDNNSGQDFLNFLKRWLFQHIRKDDKLFGDFLIERGIV